MNTDNTVDSRWEAMGRSHPSKRVGDSSTSAVLRAKADLVDAKCVIGSAKSAAEPARNEAATAGMTATTDATAATPNLVVSGSGTAIRSKSVVGNLLWLMSDQGLRMVLALALNALIARMLSVEEFGAYSFTVAALLFGRRFISAGLDGVLTQALVETPKDAPTLMGTALVIRAFWGLLTSAAICIFLTSSGAVAGGNAWLLLAGLVANVALCVEVVDNQFQAAEAARVPARARTVAWISISVIQMAIVASGGRMRALLCAQALYPLCYGAILLFAASRQDMRLKDFSWCRSAARRLMSAAWPLLVSAIGVALYVRFGSVMLGLLSSDREVAIYSVAAQFVDAWHIVPPLVVSALFPRLLRLNTADNRKFQEAVSALFALLFYAGVLICFSYWSCIGFGIKILFGKDYASAALVTSLLVLTIPFAAWGALLSRVIIAERATTFSITRHIAGAGVGLLTSWTLIPRWGALGAAAGSVAAFVVSCYAAAWFDPRMRAYASFMTHNLLNPKRAIAVCGGLLRNSHG